MNKSELRRILTNRDEYVQSLQIKSVYGRIGLRYNNPQKKIAGILSALEAANKPVRMVILKARRMGVSTVISGLVFQDTSTRPYVHSVVAAHKDDSSTYLFGMYKMFFKYLPAELRPMTTYSSRKELVYANSDWEKATPAERLALDPGLDSRLSVVTAGGEAIGRGQSIDNLHWSEVAFTPDADTAHIAVMQCVPKPPIPGRVFYESTANGSSGLFYDLFWDAWRGKSDWTPVFLPWFEYERYAMAVPPGFALSREEYRIKNEFHLENEQLAWRRWVINNELKGSIDAFHQEYPATPEEAFQSKTNCAFDSKALTEMRTQLKPPKYTCDFTQDGLVETSHGEVSVWEMPQPEAAYVIGVDASEGTLEGCMPVTQVLKITSVGLVQVAVYAEKVQPLQFALKTERLGRAYNNALINPERNQQGAAIIAILLDKRYPNVYIADDGRYGTYAGELGAVLMVNSAAHLAWKRELTIQDERTWNAMAAYENKNGRFLGRDDDYVDALRAATYALPKAVRSTHIATRPTVAEWTNWTFDMWDRYQERNHY